MQTACGCSANIKVLGERVFYRYQPYKAVLKIKMQNSKASV